MRYEEKFIKHKPTKYSNGFIEIVAKLELSEGDLIRLRMILKESKNEWSKDLLKNIEESFRRKSIQNGI